MGASLSTLKLSVLASLIWSVTGCASLQYYAQAIGGHTRLLLQRESVEKAISSTKLDAAVRSKLRLTTAIRAFAASAGLKTGDAYTTYVATGEPYVIWNVFAAPEFSLEMKQFCFPIVGCTTYKGYFRKGDAEKAAAKLEGQGYDVYVGGVAAYSTLGWFSDPILDSFLRRSDAQLAALIFHELAHRELYVPGDSQFNESFATAIERHLLAKWLAAEHRLEELGDFNGASGRRAQVLGIVADVRDQLASVYSSELSTDEKRVSKHEALEQLRARYLEVHESWHGHNDYFSWVNSDINNAKLGTLSTYNDWVDSFDVMLRDQGGDVAAFVMKVRELSDRDRVQRDQVLTDLLER